MSKGYYTSVSFALEIHIENLNHHHTQLYWNFNLSAEDIRKNIFLPFFCVKVLND